MCAYNHEKFIAQAIDSVLMQRTDFKYDLVIGEDCSTDSTRAIVHAYGEGNPEQVRPLLHARNLGRQGGNNFVAVLNACRGQYIAMLDGDDYWTDPGKLQKQVKFLDSHPECAICFHDVEILGEDPSEALRDYYESNRKKFSTLEDLLINGDFIPTCSVVFRRNLFGNFPDWYSSVTSGDYVLHVLNAQYGDIGYLDEVMAVYRIHGGGSMSRRSSIEKCWTMIESREAILPHLGARYTNVINQRLIADWNDLACAYRDLGVLQGTPLKSIGHLMNDWQRFPSGRALSKSQKNRMLSVIYAGLAFSASGKGEHSKARGFLINLLRHDLSWLNNRGVWSIGIQSFLGRRTAKWLRQAWRLVFSRLLSSS